MKEIEVWKPVPQFEGLYEISSHGRLKKIKEDNTEKIIKSFSNIRNRGYLQNELVKLENNKKKTKTIQIHKLVAKMFVAKDGDDKKTKVLHENGIVTDNYYKNLKYISDPMVPQPTLVNLDGKKNVVIGYVRVSTESQDTEKNQNQILRFANAHNFGQVAFVTEKVSGAVSWKNRKLKNVVESLFAGDVIIVPELSRIGRNIIDIFDVLEILTNKGVKIYSVKENFQLNGEDIQSKIMKTMFSLFSEIERDLMIARVREGVEAAKAQGKICGRPKGSGKSKLDSHRFEIIAQIESGLKKSAIAESFGLTPGALSAWLKRNKLTETNFSLEKKIKHEQKSSKQKEQELRKKEEKAKNNYKKAQRELERIQEEMNGH